MPRHEVRETEGTKGIRHRERERSRLSERQACDKRLEKTDYSE